MNDTKDNNVINIAKFTLSHSAAVDSGSAAVDGGVRVGLVDGDQIRPLRMTADFPTLQSILNAESPSAAIAGLKTDAALPLADIQWLPPIDTQEVWAAGVTYKKSQTARMEESEAAASCYDRVYNAERPELFFKAVPHRVRGHLQPLRIRVDSKWNVPEPEITLVVSEAMKIVGLTCGNDMSSRDIEGENPLYLPQAKCYDQSAGLGPWISLYDSLPSAESIKVDLKIERSGEIVFTADTAADQMARKFDDLVQWLSRDTTFPGGVFLMTGTGIVPTTAFTLQPGDNVHISIAGIGTLSNSIVQG